MIRRTIVGFALLVAVACERQPSGPVPPYDLSPLNARAEDDGPPPPRRFGPDSRETGVNTGEGVQATGLSCETFEDSGRRRCTGFLASSVDHTRLDVTLDVPSGPGPHALVALLHGWAGGKHNQSDITGELLDHGLAVLRYSARGFGNSYGLVNLADVGVEIGDLRSVIGQVIDIDQAVTGPPGYRPDFTLNADAVAVGGASYGGGQSWLALVQPTFQSPAGVPVSIRAVVPIVPWTDLLYSLLPNGRPRNSVAPPGALKWSYENALYSSGCRNPPTCDNYATYLKTWHASLNANEPSLDPLYPQIRDGLAGYRSIWWQRTFWQAAATNRVPVFQVQGFTDDLFTLDEAKRMLLALKTVDPTYPITSYFGDLGHPRARNKTGEVEYALGLLTQWLVFHLKGEGTAPEWEIYAAITRPSDDAFSEAHVIMAPSYAALSEGVVSHQFSATAVLVNPLSGTGGALTDPLLQVAVEQLKAALVGAGELEPYAGTATEPAPDPTAASYAVPVASLNPDPPSALLIAGQPTVTLRVSTEAPRVQLNVRLFEVEGTVLNGTRRLITRGTYTLDSGSLSSLGTVDVTIPTQGNLWCAANDHTLVLEVSNVDTPYIAPSRIASVTEISNVKLDVPTRSPLRCGGT
jgi:ABC-2 type transport system ATP-binding protein